jgi:adenosine deaminase
MQQFADYFREAKEAGLGVTLHIAEVILSSLPYTLGIAKLLHRPIQTAANSSSETLQLLSFSPDRLGHATFLDNEAKAIVSREKICIEICLSSNLLWVKLSFAIAFYSSQRRIY